MCCRPRPGATLAFRYPTEASRAAVQSPARPLDIWRLLRTELTDRTPYGFAPGATNTRKGEPRRRPGDEPDPVMLEAGTGQLSTGWRELPSGAGWP